MATDLTREGYGREKSTETKASFKTTELIAYVLILIGLFIAGAVTEGDIATETVDELSAGKVWLYAVILTVGYMLSRGLAKSGSHDPYTDSPGGPGVGDRMRAAGDALREGR